MNKVKGYVKGAQLEALERQMRLVEQERFSRFQDDLARLMAARLLALVIPETPVGHYEKGFGRTGGTLRRGWTGGQAIRGDAYAKGLKVEQSGRERAVQVVNPVVYASYVEYGHAQTPGRYVPSLGRRLVRSQVEGRYFLAKSEEKLAEQAPDLVEQRLQAFLKEVLSDA